MPPDAVVDDPLRLSYYGYDGTFYEGKPDVVLLPETTEQVSAAVKLLAERGVPIVPRGAATSLSGGPVPLRGGVVFSFSRMDRILDIDYVNERAVVQPGVVNLQFQGILARNRFFYAPDPASQCVCTLGGNVGENSGGPHCLKYGVTANHILGLTMVLPDGSVLRTGLDQPGYDLTGLIVGSEGTFGLVTEIVCRIMPLPESVVTMLAIFDTLSGASQSVSDIIAEGIIPATLEMMDNTTIRAVEMGLHAGYPIDAEAVLLIELDGPKSALPGQVSRVAQVCHRNAVRDFRVAENDAERALLWKGRKGAFGAVVNIAPSKICTDISVPRTELPKALAAVVEIGRKFDLPIANVFHAGDGNLHPLILFDPRDHGQLERARRADQEITQLAVKYGGVLTGEHGIGCGKRQYMTLMFSPSDLRLMHRIKDVFDPAHLCNPDKVLPDLSEIAEPDLPDLTYRSLDLQPLDQEAVRATLAIANRDGVKLILRGAGIRGYSGPTLAPDMSRRVLHLDRLNRIISHDHENLTVTVECGVTLRQLDEALAEKNQMLPFGMEFDDRETLGGIIASDQSGPSRLQYGTARDYVTGIKAALPSGEIISFGSTCVKNVAGYAIEKLLIGSRGTLAAILEITLRTVPRTTLTPSPSPSEGEGRSASLAFEGRGAEGDPASALQEGIKRAFDPNGVLPE